jgi:predicted HTH transcriptional regulator
VHYTPAVDLRNKFVSQISRAEILDAVAQRRSEDDYLEFKSELLHSRKPAKVLDDDKEDLLADLVAFANAAGGLILVGVSEDSSGRAESLKAITGDEAKKLANAVRDLAVAHIKPGILQLEVVPFQMNVDGSEWIVIVRVPDGIDKPYMSTYRDQTRFAIRVGNRKRSMAYEEVQQNFLANPQQAQLAKIFTEIASLRSLVSDLRKRMDG